MHIECSASHRYSDGILSHCGAASLNIVHGFYFYFTNTHLAAEDKYFVDGLERFEVLEVCTSCEKDRSIFSLWASVSHKLINCS